MTRYDAPTLLDRARELGIEVSTDGQALKLRARTGAISEKARAVLAAHKQVLIAYLLRSQQVERTAGSDMPPAAEDSSAEDRFKAASSPISSQGCATCCVHILSPGIDFRFTPAGTLYCLEHYAAWEREQQGGNEAGAALPEKGIITSEGVRIVVGYTDAEYKVMLYQEAIAAEVERAQRLREQATRLRSRERNHISAIEIRKTDVLNNIHAGSFAREQEL
jgi:hypothetical protein